MNDIQRNKTNDEDLRLFDDFQRWDTRRGPSTGKRESEYEFWNRWADSLADEVRARWEMWFQRYPMEARRHLVGRFRSKEEAHDGAGFELYLHELLRCLGFGVTVTDMSGAGKEPDFLVEYQGKQFYLEATSVQTKVRMSHAVRDAWGKFDKVRSQHCLVAINLSGELQAEVPAPRLVESIRRLLGEHDHPDTRSVHVPEGSPIIPTHRYRVDGLNVEVDLLHIANDRADDGYKPMILGPSGIVNEHGEVKQLESKTYDKTSKFKSLNAPLVVAAKSTYGFFKAREHGLYVVFGRRASSRVDDYDGFTARRSRTPDGIWWDVQGEPAHTYLAGMWTFGNVSAHRPDMSSCLYLSPHISTDWMPEPLTRVEHAPYCDGQIEWVEGIPISQILGLTE